ncbi:uncharacterized protein LOC142463566 isoform X3 [Ascaphus truei]|uniref:uncharacterized protein LOC142463566 isoform X3 n=1 Tax=Ascaphus truei TaxID=8439 RepID=UPI003F5958AB
MAFHGFFFLLLILRTLFLPVDAMLEVNAPSPHSALLGSDVTLPCTFGVGNEPVNPQFLAVLWFFGGKEILRSDNKGKSLRSGVVFNEQETRTGIASLRLPNVNISDGGIYQCKVIYSPEIRTKDVRLAVYAQPTITLLEKSATNEEKDQLLCSVTGFYPMDITVTLLRNKQVLNGSSLSNHQMNIDGTYRVNSTVTILPTEKLKGQTLSCQVQHTSLPVPLQKDTQLVYEADGKTETNVMVLVASIIGSLVLIGAVIAVFCFLNRRKKGFRRLLVSNIQGPQTWIDGEKTTMYCTASYCPEDVHVTWIVKKRDGTTCEIPEIPSVETEEEEPLMSREYLVNKKKADAVGIKGLYDFTSSFSFIPSISRHVDSSLVCKFVCGEKTEEKTFVFKSIYAKPKVLEPIQLTICESGDVLHSLKLESFYPRDIQISWSCGEGKAQDEKTFGDDIQSNSNNTFSLESKCKTPGNLFKDPAFKVWVTWKHASMDVSESRELSAKDFPWRPQIEDRPIQSVLVNNEVKLHCTISKYFPDALTVKWFEKRKGSRELFPASASEKYKIPEIRSGRETGKTFTCKACLVFTKPQSSEQEAEFICRVEHPSLDQPIELSTGPLRETEIPGFMVSSIQGPDKWSEGEKVTLYCTASYCTEDVQVAWIMTERDGTVREISEIPKGVELVPRGYVVTRERTDISDREGLQDFTTSLSFIPSMSEHKSMTLICKFVCGGKSKEKRFEHKCLYAKPKVSGPVKLAFGDLGEELCSLDLQKFYPKDIQIHWSCGVGHSQKTMTSVEHVKDNDLTFDVHSECSIFGHLFKDPAFTVQVSWKHDSMDVQESRELSVRGKEFPWHPEIQEIPIPNLFITNPVTLVCKISNIYPDILGVKWLKKEKDSQDLFPLVHSEKYKIPDTRLEKQTDQTFSCKACLTFTPSVSTEQGAEFICRVEHPSLEKPKERTTGPLGIIGFPKVKDITRSEDGTLTLDVDGFYPKIITISWKVALQSSVEESKTLTSTVIFTENSDGSYKVTSSCDPRNNDLNENKPYVVTATVEHGALESPIHKTTSFERKYQEIMMNAPLSQEQNHPSTSADAEKETSTTESSLVKPQRDYQRFIVNTIQGPQKWTNGKNVTLYCTASYCTEDVNVTWIVRERGGRGWEISDSPTGESKKQEALVSSGYVATREWTEKSDKEGLFNITSSLIFTPSLSKHTGMALICKFVCDGETKEKRLEIKSIHAKPMVLDPIKLTLCDSGELLYSLNLQCFYPKDLKISWTRRVEQSQCTKTSREQLQENSDLTFNLQSECQIPGNLLKDPAFKLCVRWEHETMDGPESRELSLRDPDFPWHPTIQEIPVAHILSDRPFTLQFRISEYFPDSLAVTWFKKEKGSQELLPVSHSDKYSIPDIRSGKQANNTYTCTACLSFTPSLSSEQGAVFICRVEHPSLERPTEGKTRPLQIMAKPKIMGSLQLSLCDSGEVLCSVTLHSLYPNDIHIRWCCGTRPSPQTLTSKEKCKENSDLTFNVTSECRIPGNLLKDPASKTCVTWKHESMDYPESRECSIRDLDFPWRPEMADILIPRLLINEQVTLRCQISKYFPDALTVKWFKKDKGHQEFFPVSPSEKYNISDTRSDRQTDQSYLCNVGLSFVPSLKAEQGAEFICRVEHPSLEQPIEKGTGALQIIANPKMLEPINLAVLDSGHMLYSLNLQSFYPKHIQMEWCCSGQSQGIIQSKETFTDNSDLTCNVLSECITPGNLFQDPNLTLSVTWRHESMIGPETRTMSVRDPGFPWNPAVEEIHMPGLFADQEVTLQCKISNCLPAALTVKWFKKEKGSQELFPLSHNEKYKIPEIRSDRETQNSFTCTSCLVFIPLLQTEQGAEFICRVDHPGLGQPIEKGTGPLQIQGPQNPCNLFTSDGDFSNLQHFYPNFPTSHMNSGTEMRGGYKVCQPSAQIFSFAGNQENSTTNAAHEITDIQEMDIGSPNQENRKRKQGQQGLPEQKKRARPGTGQPRSHVEMESSNRKKKRSHRQPRKSLVGGEQAASTDPAPINNADNTQQSEEMDQG